MSTGEFSGIGFAAGVVRGTRSFDVDILGRLTGVSYKQVWTPGENDAICRKDEDRYWGGITIGGRPSKISYTFNVVPTIEYSYEATAVGQGAKRSWVDSILGTSPQTARAAEEAARRAKEEAERAEEERKEKERLEAERKARDTLADCSHGFYGYYDGSNDYYEKGRVMGVVEGYGETVIGTRGFRCMKARIVALRIPKHVPERLRNLVLRNYPDVAFFDTFAAMVAEFPPDDAGAGITPANDPEFWTRSI